MMISRGNPILSHAQNVVLRLDEEAKSLRDHLSQREEDWRHRLEDEIDARKGDSRAVKERIDRAQEEERASTARDLEALKVSRCYAGVGRKSFSFGRNA